MTRSQLPHTKRQVSYLSGSSTVLGSCDFLTSAREVDRQGGQTGCMFSLLSCLPQGSDLLCRSQGPHNGCGPKRLELALAKFQEGLTVHLRPSSFRSAVHRRASPD